VLGGSDGAAQLRFSRLPALCGQPATCFGLVAAALLGATVDFFDGHPPEAGHNAPDRPRQRQRLRGTTHRRRADAGGSADRAPQRGRERRHGHAGSLPRQHRARCADRGRCSRRIHAVGQERRAHRRGANPGDGRPTPLATLFDAAENGWQTPCSTALANGANSEQNGGAVIPDDEAHTVQRRIRHAKQTAAVLDRLLREPTLDNVVAFHELHARHLRASGDEDGAARADERADHARRLAATRNRSSSPAATLPDRPGGAPSVTGGEDRPRNVDTPPDSRRSTPPGRAAQAQHAQAASQRANAALQRAVEGTERAEAYERREKAGRERSSASRRRLRATDARATASMRRSAPEERADEHDRSADERERVADDRERTADERDKAADRRDRIADRRDRSADERERVADARERLLKGADDPGRPSSSPPRDSAPAPD
jgi:hypothetical protein